MSNFQTAISQKGPRKKSSSGPGPGRGILSRGAMHFPLNFSQVQTC